MRVSDADRAAVADLLGRHYSAGRLNGAEFEERLDRALRATTMADITGLLSDLPDADSYSPQVPSGSRRQQRKLVRIQLEREQLRLRHEQHRHHAAERSRRAQALRWLLLAIALLIAVTMIVRVLSHSAVAWLVLGLVALLWLRRPGPRAPGRRPDREDSADHLSADDPGGSGPGH